MVSWGWLLIAFLLGVFVTARFTKWLVVWWVVNDHERATFLLLGIIKSAEDVIQAEIEERRKKEDL